MPSGVSRARVRCQRVRERRAAPVFCPHGRQAPRARREAHAAAPQAPPHAARSNCSLELHALRVDARRDGSNLAASQSAAVPAHCCSARARQLITHRRASDSALAGALSASGVNSGQEGRGWTDGDGTTNASGGRDWIDVRASGQRRAPGPVGGDLIVQHVALAAEGCARIYCAAAVR